MNFSESVRRLAAQLAVPLVGLLALALIAAGCSAGAQGIKIQNPYVRISTADKPAAAFLTIVNDSDTDDSLVSATSPAFGTIQLHETVAVEPGSMSSPAASASMGAMPGASGGAMPGSSMEAMPSASMGSTMAMRPVAEIPVAAHGSRELKPGGYHLMLFDPTGTLAPGQTVEITLTFKHAGAVKVTAEVRGA